MDIDLNEVVDKFFYYEGEEEEKELFNLKPISKGRR